MSSAWRRLISSPRRRTVPEVAGVSPEMARSVVVLPAPVGADQGDDLPLVDVQADRAERLDAAVEDVDLLDVENRGH